MKCYNAGQITGLPYLVAYSNFDKYDKVIESMGMTPVNPMKEGLRPSCPWWMHMIYDLWLMARCQHVYFQPNWTESRGARIEFVVARLLRKEITYYIC